ncbi:MAG: transcriptional regulator [Thermoplasmatota archaeon]
MQRSDLIDAVRSTLARAGFSVSERCDLRPISFDLVARRDRDLLILKVLTNVDALSEPIAHEIKLLCRFLEGRPLLVGLRAGTGELEDGVVYNRHDIPIVTPGTLAEYILDGAAPMVLAAPGGFYVNLDPMALRAARQEQAMSLGVLAQIAGVSRRAIQMYEEGMRASIDAAMRLEEFLQTDLIRPMDPLAAYEARTEALQPEPEPADTMEEFVRRMLEGLGYEVRATRRSPFDALSTQGPDTVLTGMGAESPHLRKRARIVHSVSKVTQRPGFFVVERTTRTELDGLPVVSRTELRRLADPQAILELILERQRGDSG